MSTFHGDLAVEAGSADPMPTDREAERLIHSAFERLGPPRVDGLPPTVGRLVPEVSTSILGEASEAELRDDEVVCPVTGYTYYAGLDRSPHVDEEGRICW